MTLGEFVGNLQQRIDDDPQNADLTVIFSIDDEGNGFKPVTFDSAIGEYDGEDFSQDEDSMMRNAICIN